MKKSMKLAGLLFVLVFPVVVSAGDFSYITNNGTITLTGYSGSGAAVVIPDTLGGLPVTRIERSSFSGCSNLTSITIPATISSIGHSPFSGCFELTSIIVDDLNSDYCSVDGVLYDKTKTEILLCPEGMKGSFVVLDSVTHIGDFAFAGCSKLTSLTISAGVASIGDDAFFRCSGLTSLTIPTGVTSIGDDAFHYCSGLTGALTIPSGVTTIGEDAFSGCSRLTSLTIAAGVTNIGESAFAYCSGLTGSLTIPASVTSIGNDAFAYRSGLTSITVDELNSAYSSVDGVLYNKSQTELIQCPSGKTGGLILPSSLTTIRDRAFPGCTGLTGTLTIPSGVTSIGDGAFSGCSNLTGRLTIPAGVTNIGVGTFYNCSGLTGNLMIPAGVTSIGMYAFYGCSGLMGSLTIPAGVTNIGRTAFCRCSGLTGNLTIPAGVTSIEDEAFLGCFRLTSLTIPAGVTNIGGRAFFGCDGLISITVDALNSAYSSVDGILYNKTKTHLLLYPSRKTGRLVVPRSVTRIRDWAFSGRAGVKEIYFLGDAPTFRGFFSGYNSRIIIYRVADAKGWPPIPDLWAGCPTALWQPDSDDDADGLPAFWELQYFGGTTNANPNAICSNGINTVLHAYSAGLNPNEPQSR